MSGEKYRVKKVRKWWFKLQRRFAKHRDVVDCRACELDAEILGIGDYWREDIAKRRASGSGDDGL